ncbi:MAG: hypothetical protein AB7I33_15580 [Gemmatimonadales bacterium]
MDAWLSVRLLLPATGIALFLRRILIHIRRPRPVTSRDRTVIKYERLEILSTILTTILAVGPFLLPFAYHRWVFAVCWAGAGFGFLAVLVFATLRDRVEGPGRPFIDSL